MYMHPLYLCVYTSACVNTGTPFLSLFVFSLLLLLLFFVVVCNLLFIVCLFVFLFVGWLVGWFVGCSFAFCSYF